MMILLLCLASVSLTASDYRSPSARAKYISRRAPQALRVCSAVGARALASKIPLAEIIALSHTESRHTWAVSRAGARGPLQALLRYWKRAGDLDEIDAGLRAWIYYRRKFPDTRQAVGAYNGGGSRTAYARAYIAHEKEMRSILWKIKRYQIE
jgi:hypothetical protein